MIGARPSAKASMSSRGGGGGGRAGRVGGGGGGGAGGGGGGGGGGAAAAAAGGGGDFGRAVARAAVARMLEAAGFVCAHRSAVDALVDVLLRYICQLGRAATFHANLAGRAAANECDVIQFLEECGAAYYGFAGAASVSARCLANSAVVKDMAVFVGASKESPFAGRPLPRFPVQRVPLHSTTSFAVLGRESGMSHVPEWLPAFPEPHTYVRSELWSEEVAKAGADEVERARQRRKAEKSLLSLQRRLALAGADGFRPGMLVDDAVKANGLDVVESKANPFHERALPYGEKVVSEVTMPGVGKTFSVVEAFAPAFEESKGGEFDEGMDQGQNDSQTQKRVVPKERPPVYFRIGIDKKSMVMALNSRALVELKDPWFFKEDKEQRAELILREAMDNPHELTQL